MASRSSSALNRNGAPVPGSRAITRFVIVLGLAVVHVGAQVPPPSDRERLDTASKRTAQRLRALQREADSLAAQERTLLGELRKLEVDRQIAVEKLAQIERDSRDVETRMADAEAKAAVLAEKAAEQLPDVEARLVQLYKMGRAGYWRLLLNADDLHGVGRAYRTASMLTAIDRARVNEHYATLDALAAERKALHARAGELASLRTEAATAKTALDKAVLGRSALIESIDSRRDLNAQLMSELQGAQQKLQGALDQLAAGRSGTIALPFRVFQGDLPWPAEGRVIGRFGRPHGSAGSVRNGIAIDLTEGSPVRSVHDGTVLFADHFAGYGNLVIIDHGSKTYSLYGFLRSVEVLKGARVRAGTEVGTSGTEPGGKPTAYFELRVDGTPVDPLQWLGKQP